MTHDSWCGQPEFPRGQGWGVGAGPPFSRIRSCESELKNVQMRLGGLAIVSVAVAMLAVSSSAATVPSPTKLVLHDPEDVATLEVPVQGTSEVQTIRLPFILQVRRANASDATGRRLIGAAALCPRVPRSPQYSPCCACAGAGAGVGLGVQRHVMLWHGCVSRQKEHNQPSS